MRLQNHSSKRKFLGPDTEGQISENKRLCGVYKMDKIEIENNKACMWAKQAEYTAEIYGEVEGLEDLYILQLLKWASSVWTYDQVETWEWKQSEEIADSCGSGYYIIWNGKPGSAAYLLHICDVDDEKGLFDGAWPDSPKKLEDYKERITQMKIRIEESLSSHECASCGNECPSRVYEAVGCPFCGQDARIK